jgi:hypothetical protein
MVYLLLGRDLLLDVVYFALDLAGAVLGCNEQC